MNFLNTSNTSGVIVNGGAVKAMVTSTKSMLSPSEHDSGGGWGGGPTDSDWHEK